VWSRPEGLHDILGARARPGVDVGERGIDERVGGGRTDTGPDNRQEIVSEIRE
jgi:hypothetical protein